MKIEKVIDRISMNDIRDKVNVQVASSSTLELREKMWKSLNKDHRYRTNFQIKQQISNQVNEAYRN